MSVSVEIKTRPIRLAFLVDPNNSEQVGEAIRLSSTLWGGVYFPIIELHKRIPATWKEEPLPKRLPTERPSARSVILGHIDAFDPDFLVQLPKSIPRYIRDLGIRMIKPEDLWGDLNEDGEPYPGLGIGLFEVIDRILEEDSPGVRIVFPKLPKEFSLFWASVFGDVPPELDKLLENCYFRQPEISWSEFDNNRAVEFLENPRVLFPIQMVRCYTEIYSSVFDIVPHLFFMDAEKVGDIVDFWNLRAMGKLVLPVPRQLKEDPGLKKIVDCFLKQPQRGGGSARDKQISIPARMLKARNWSVEEMRKYAGAFGDRSLEFHDRYPRFRRDGPHHEAPRDVYGNERSFISPVDTREEDIKIRSLLPKFRYYGRRRPVCANEITIDSYMGADLVAEAFPRSSGENFRRVLSGATSSPEDWRVGRNGLIRLAENGFFRPQEVPSAEKVFFAWLGDHGWRPELSTLGVLAKRIHERMGGYVPRLQDEKLLWLLEYMNGGSVDLDRGPSGEKESSQEREMSVAQVKSRLEREEPGRKSLYDYVVEKGFFRLGARVRCPNCSRHSWYALESIRDSLACPKCLDAFPAIGNLDAGGRDSWYYRTAGPFSIPNYADGAYAVLLTLDFFNALKLKSHSFHMTPVMSFTAESSENKRIEVDFAAFWQGGPPERRMELLIGESKTYGKFGDRDFERIRYLAEAFEKPVLVFSTLRKSLEPGERKKIGRIAKTSPVMVLTGNELCPYSGAESSGGSLGNQNLYYMSSLLDICDVTRERYIEV